MPVSVCEFGQAGTGGGWCLEEWRLSHRRYNLISYCNVGVAKVRRVGRWVGGPIQESRRGGQQQREGQGADRGGRRLL